MEKITVKNRRLEKKEINEIVDLLNAGKIVVLPTDTIYGIHADSSNFKAINRVRKIKMIKAPRPFIILISSLRMARKYAEIDRWQSDFLKKIWPGAYSVILKAKPNKTAFGQPETDSISVRQPKNEALLKIIRKLGRPVVSTSLNIHGCEPLADLGKVEALFPKFKPDLIVDAGSLKGRKPSRIIDLRESRNPVIVR